MILVTGANGQVGQELQALQVRFSKFKMYFADRKTLDITKDISTIKSQFPNIKYIINAAAYTAVDKAESEPDLAKAINVSAVQNLAQFAKENDVRFLHISSDYVYHTEINRPYIETDVCAPKGVYAQTKLDGDLAALDVNPSSIILRTSWVYSRFGKNFVHTMLRLGRERDQLKVVFDQIGTPTNAADLAEAILQMISQLENGKTASGIFHYSNEGVTSWYDFAKAIFDIKNIPCHVKPIESKDYPTPASRPHFSVLNKSKIKAAFDLDISHWRESLRGCLAEI